MLERECRRIDITPDYFPFIKSSNKATYSDTDWRSVTRQDFGDEGFVPRSPNLLPEVAPREPYRKHNPHSQNVYHLYNIEHARICNVKGSPLEVETEQPVPRSEMRRSFTAKPCLVSRHFTKSAAHAYNTSQADGIIPGNLRSVPNQAEERMLPVCNRNQAVLMTTKPLLHYGNRRKLTPVSDHENHIVFSEQSTRPSARDNVSSLLGKGWSRKRGLIGQQETIPVKGFNGGPPLSQKQLAKLNLFDLQHFGNTH